LKITLIQPTKPVYGAEAEQHWQLTRPLSLFFLASSLQKYTKHKVEIIDLEQKKYRNISLEEIFSKSHDSQIFGITATTYTRFEAVKIARYLKSVYSNSLIIAGGVHFMYCAEDTLKNISEIDIVVRGEGEITIVELVNAISEGKSLENVTGITYRINNNIVTNKEQEIFEDLDSLPLYLNFNYEEYPEYLFGYTDHVRAISIMTSRGCPYKCIFCSKAGMKYRLRNVKNVVDEMEVLKDKFNIEGLNFLDLTFTANPNHVRALCQEMIDRKINLKWWCESRANIPLELLENMKKAGCVSLVVGVESGSPDIISKISKNISIQEVINFCKRCNKLDIFVQPYFMYSHPDETEKDLEKTLALIDELEQFTLPCSLQPTIILPGTEIERLARSKGILPEKFSWYDDYKSYLNIELGQLINIPLYIDKLNPDIIKKYIKERNDKVSMKAYIKYSNTLNLKEKFVKVINSIIKGKPSSRYIFHPRFYYEYIMSKLKK